MNMHDELTVTITRLVAALIAGAIIGLERSYNGRPAGFRTHALVCMSSSLLMLLTVYQWDLLQGVPLETIRVDPTRMAQGIMTGIGFLGAGVIMKESYTIRGLTTAASIWVTASIGILVGIGFYDAAIAATVLAFSVLSLFRWLENKLPTLEFARLEVRVRRHSPLTEEKLNEHIRKHNIQPGAYSYHLEKEGRYVKFELLVSTRKPENFRSLAETLGKIEDVDEYSILPRSN